jgi:1,4-alpha-glucan branching enzyme
MSLEKHPGVGLCEVTFRRRTTNGETSAAVVGDFNDWSPWSHEMTPQGEVWSLRVALPPGRRYRFRYLIDHSRWENDWEADDYVGNAFGGQDSVLDLDGLTPPAGEASP